MAETTTQAPKVLQVPSTVKNLIEALIFAAKEPLSVKQIKAIYEQQGAEGELRVIESDEIREIIAALNEDFQRADKPYRIIQIAGGYQFATLSQYAEWLGKLYKEQSRRKLSQSSTETLAIIAYKQPIARPEIEAIRGVNCDYVLATLLEKDLVTITGRAPTPGRPLLYGTTREFLKHFGLNEITDLPRPREIEEILGESQFETERRMLEAQAGVLEMKKEEEDFKSRLPHIPQRKPELDSDVKIFPRKKQREIRTIQSGELAPEASEQEKVDFHQDQRSAPPLSTEVEPDGLTLPPVKKQTEESTMRLESPQTDGGDAEDLQRDSLKSDELTETEKLVKPEMTDSSTISQQIEEKPVFPQEPSVPTTANNDIPTSVLVGSSTPRQEHLEPSKPIQTAPENKSPWHTWKEKIQTFIRKLFG